ncbi:uncharacterized protein LOC110037829 [Phalaenopsis equestris]|uniref:uncharacterized protein LOC110037829 n=1 Tax=Phalaenopsis equestris TaxID=78828 RepID=UPI0009E36DCA|nr:uncharacterized protein LOC110037829 [Phalaenopsis equestris]
MIMYDQDPDVLRWGLHLLQGDFLNSAYGEGTIRSDANIYQAAYSTQCNVALDCSNFENDEIIAHALQEELSQVALAEARGTSPAGEEHLQASVLAQAWLGPAARDSTSGAEIS